MFDQSGNDCGIMPQVEAMKLANDAGFNLYFMETEAEPPVAIFTSKDQSRELGQKTFESGRRVVARHSSEASKNHAESKSPVKQTNSTGSKNLAESTSENESQTSAKSTNATDSKPAAKSAGPTDSSDPKTDSKTTSKSADPPESKPPINTKIPSRPKFTIVNDPDE